MSEDMRTPAQAAMDKLMNEAGQRAADRNVEMLRGANRSLEQPPWQNRNVDKRQMPGSRPDGGMAPAAIHQSIIKELVNQILQHDANLQGNLADAHNLVDKFEAEQLRLEDEILQLKAALQEESRKRIGFENRCDELKTVLRQAAEVMVNGEKGRG